MRLLVAGLVLLAACSTVKDTIKQDEKSTQTEVVSVAQTSTSSTVTEERRTPAVEVITETEAELPPEVIAAILEAEARERNQSSTQPVSVVPTSTPGSSVMGKLKIRRIERPLETAKVERRVEHTEASATSSVRVELATTSTNHEELHKELKVGPPWWAWLVGILLGFALLAGIGKYIKEKLP
jgi:hypothetical protein